MQREQPSRPVPDDEPSRSPDPRGLRRGRDPQRCDSPGSQALERVLSMWESEFKAMVRSAASQYNVGYDDLYQETSMRLLKQHKVDPDHQGFRAWVKGAVAYAAKSLRRSESARPTPLGPDEFPDAEMPDSGDDPGWEAELRSILDNVLTEDQLRVILEIIREPEIRLYDLAKLVNQSYANTRKLKERARKTLRDHIGVTDDEFVDFVRCRRNGGPDTSLARSASDKVQRFLVGEGRQRCGCTGFC